MTDIEFLVSELRKAHETIDKLNKEIVRLKAEMGKFMLHNTRMCSKREMAELWKRTIENM